MVWAPAEGDPLLVVIDSRNQLIDEDPHTSELTTGIPYFYKIKISNLGFICSESI